MRCVPGLVGLGVACALAGCALEPSRSAAIDALPDDVAWVAAVIEAEGEVVSATGLHPPSALAGGTLLRPEGDGRLVLVGFTASQLAPWGPPDAETLLRTALRPPAVDESALPRPSFEAVGEGAQSDLRSRPPTLTLTADWVEGCPTLLPTPTSLVDLSCALRFCEGEARQVGCNLEVEAIACGGGLLEATVGAQGDLRFAASDELGICTPLDDPDAVVAAACTGLDTPCEVRVRAEAPEVVWDVDLVPIVGAEPDVFRDRETPLVADGWIGAFAVLSDRALVFDFDGAFSPDCLDAGGRVHVVDLDSLEVTRTATAPACVQVAEVEAGGQSALVLYGRVDPLLGRIDANGRVVRSVPLDLPHEGAPVMLSDIDIVDGRVTVLAGVFGRDLPEYLSVYDAETLAPLARTPPLEERTSMIQPLVTGGVVVVNRGSSEMIEIDLETGALGTQIALRQLCGGRGHHDMTGFPGADAYALTSLQDRAELRIVSSRLDECRAHRFLEARVDQTVLRPAPGNPRQLVVGMVEAAPPRAARLAVFDADAGRFLVGTAELGPGIMDQLQADSAGRLWVSLPWTGRVARVGRRP